MKLIFSRKGIDDAYGKGASPIFPNGQMLSIPIPVKGQEKGIPYKDLHHLDISYQRLIKQLQIPIRRKTCHFDPDLNPMTLERTRSWKPCLGHHGAAVKHLFNQGIAVGDVFLFFGSFRHIKQGKYKQWNFMKESRKQHILYGYLRIEKILNLKDKAERQEAIYLGYENHPHVQNDYKGQNVLFIASDAETGAGLFKYNQELVLTQAGSTKSIWELPAFFYDLKISRHEKRERFNLQNDKTILKTVGIGQEFVVEENSQVTDWTNALIS